MLSFDEIAKIGTLVKKVDKLLKTQGADPKIGAVLVTAKDSLKSALDLHEQAKKDEKQAKVDAANKAKQEAKYKADRERAEKRAEKDRVKQEAKDKVERDRAEKLAAAAPATTPPAPPAE